MNFYFQWHMQRYKLFRYIGVGDYIRLYGTYPQKQNGFFFQGWGDKIPNLLLFFWLFTRAQPPVAVPWQRTLCAYSILIHILVTSLVKLYKIHWVERKPLSCQAFSIGTCKLRVQRTSQAKILIFR